MISLFVLYDTSVLEGIFCAIDHQKEAYSKMNIARSSPENVSAPSLSVLRLS